MPQRPNILWICTDQQRWDTLGCAGNPHVRTPNLDALARGGVLCRHAFSQSPVCTPSRASFLTGRYPRTTRCRQNGQGIPPDEVLVTRLLAGAGYRCGLAGKLHLNPCDPEVLAGRPEPRTDDGYDVFHWHHDHWPWSAYGQWLKERGIEAGFADLDGVRGVQVGPVSDGTPTAWASAMAERFIETHSQGPRADRPWLFSLNLFDPHHPFRIPADRVDDWRQRAADLPLPAYRPGELADKPIWQRIDHGGAYAGSGLAYERLSDDDHRWIRAAYYAMVENIDQHVGRLMEALERTGQADRTLVMFTSDHGEMLGDHGIYLKGPYVYDPAVRVPLVFHGGGVAGGRSLEALVELVDLAPTLLEAVGSPSAPGMQGRSLWPLLTDAGAADRHRPDVYCEYYNANFPHEPKAYLTMVRTDRWKLALAHGRGEGELYDLANDPGEVTNLWNDPGAAEIKSRILVRLADRMAETVDPLPLRQGRF